MSIQYCHNCDKHIDTDYDAEHFEDCPPTVFKKERVAKKYCTCDDHTTDYCPVHTKDYGKWKWGENYEEYDDEQ
jgi:hypothetical protein